MCLVYQPLTMMRCHVRLQWISIQTAKSEGNVIEAWSYFAGAPVTYININQLPVRTNLDLLSRLRMGRCSDDICESSIWIYLTICSQPLTAKWSALVAILHMIISYIWDRPTDGHSLLQRCEDASKNHPRLCLKYCHWIMNSPQVHRPRR